MSEGPKKLIKGERFDTKRLVEMGLLPPEFLREEVEQWPSASAVANVDHKTRTVTFDTLPRPTKKVKR